MRTGGLIPKRLWTMSAALTMLAAGPCLAADLRDDLAACRQISSDATRLACFDRVTAAGLATEAGATPGATAVSEAPAALIGAPGASVPSAAGAAMVASPHAVATADPLDAQAKFGLNEREIAAQEVAAGARSVDAAKIQTRIVGMQQAADGHVVFTFDNGQVWRQLLPEGDMLARLGDDVVISRALLGSYWLELRSKRGCKVTRVR